MEGYITTTEAAERLGISPARVRQLVVRGDLPATKFGPVNVRAEALIANDFHLRGGGNAQSVRDARIALDAPLRIGRTVLPAHAEVHLTQQRNAATQLEAAARLSANLDRFNLGTEIRYKRQYLASGPEPPGEFSTTVLT